MKAVRFDEYGGVDVLDVREVPDARARARPGACQGQGGRASTRARRRSATGALHERWPATFPSGQGSDFAGVVDGLGPGVTGFAPGDEVIGWVDTRSSQAEYVVAEATNLAAKPAGVPWEVAGAIPVAGLHRVGHGAGRRPGRR